MFKLSTPAKSAAVNFGKALIKGAHERRELCIRLTEEVIETPLQIEAIFEAAKSAATYGLMEDSEQALFRKQLSYVRKIAGGWDALSDGQRETFTGGALPASSLVKEIEAPATEAKKEAKAADAKAKEEAEQAEREAEAKAARYVITPAEMMIHVAQMIDGKPLATFSKAEGKAYAALRDAMKAAEAAFAAEAATTLTAKAA